MVPLDFGMTSADRSDHHRLDDWSKMAMQWVTCRARDHIAGVDWWGGMDYKRYDDSGRPPSEKA
jgi:hypothetical protein